jgi:hypothetical protein
MTDNYALEIRGADRRVINESPSFPCFVNAKTAEVRRGQRGCLNTASNASTGLDLSSAKAREAGRKPIALLASNLANSLRTLR